MNIIVAGGSRGIGYELVKMLIREDSHKVIVLSRKGLILLADGWAQVMVRSLHYGMHRNLMKQEILYIT